jgi:thymidine phosphorylase
MHLGAGRAKQGDHIDPAAGIQLLRRIGDEVHEGEPVAMLYTSRDTRLVEAEERFLTGLRIALEPVSPPPLIHDL